jgi:CBS domain-containing protein
MMKSAKRGSANNSISSSNSRKDLKPVSKLRPRRGIRLSESTSIVEVCKTLASKRCAAVLLTGDRNELSGIITDHDIVRRVVARHKTPSDTIVSTVMTRDPTTVSMTDAAEAALSTMIDNHYRYLPVLDSKCEISGILDIGKCLNDAITKLEKSLNKNSSSGDQLDKLLATTGGDRNQAKLLSQLLGPIMGNAFKNQNTKTLRELLAGKPTSGYSVNPKSSILVAGMMMADNHKAALVVDNESLIGIVSFKDILTRAIAKEIDLEATEVTKIMTPEPDTVTPDTTVVEAMQIMHDNNFLTLPVCEENGTVCGVVDIMDLIYGVGGSEGWQSIFDSALDMDDNSDSRSVYSTESASVFEQDRIMPMPVYKEPKKEPIIHVTNSPYASAVMNNVPNQVVFNEGDQESMGDSLLDRTLSYPVPMSSPDRTARSAADVAFKIIDSKGHKYVVRSDGVYTKLLKAIMEKVDGVVDEKSIRLKFIDDEGDAINVSSDDCLVEAIATANQNGHQVVKLILTLTTDKGGSLGVQSKTLAMFGGGVAIMLGIGIISFLKPRN